MTTKIIEIMNGKPWEYGALVNRFGEQAVDEAIASGTLVLAFERPRGAWKVGSWLPDRKYYKAKDSDDD